MITPDKLEEIFEDEIHKEIQEGKRRLTEKQSTQAYLTMLGNKKGVSDVLKIFLFVALIIFVLLGAIFYWQWTLVLR